MTDLKNNLEEVWREELRVWINHNLSETQSILIHDLCERAYLEARNKSQKDLDLALNALQRESEENEKLKQELQKTREQLEKAEKVLNEIYDDGCSDDSKNYCHKWFRAVSKYLNSKQDKDKQGE